jgi:glycosyltransferase involved in cell wall biosynthesis
VGTGDEQSFAPPMRLLFVVEGYTDIRFVAILSEISTLTLLTPSKHYRSSGLKERLEALGLPVEVHEVSSSRLSYQIACTSYLWQHARRFDLILGQEMLRGSLSASLVGKLRRVPVLTYMCLPYAQYFACRRSRRQISLFTAVLGDLTIRTLMFLNGRLAAGCIALGPYLMSIASCYSRRVWNGLYYGVDTRRYSPCTYTEQIEIRKNLGLPQKKFLILFSSRMSHEKDPETVLRAVAHARKQGLDCAVLNLSGEYIKFIELAQELGLPDSREWVIGRPPAHPMKDLPDFYRAANCLAQSSLEEGLGMSPLEALSCGLPAVCSSVGGLKANLANRARLVPVRDPAAMAEEFLWIDQNRELARQQALVGRRYVEESWSRDGARQSLADILDSVLVRRAGKGRSTDPSYVELGGIRT